MHKRHKKNTNHDITTHGEKTRRHRTKARGTTYNCCDCIDLFLGAIVGYAGPIPKELGLLTKLKTLWLSINKLSGEDGKIMDTVSNGLITGHGC